MNDHGELIDQLVRLGTKGRQPRPSSEVALHLHSYRARPDVNTCTPSSLAAGVDLGGSAATTAP
jgi:ribulose-5-phosphate 4-epimerase/fuculose-1-phosphate aldolase